MIIIAISELIAKTERFYYPVFVSLLLISYFKMKKVKLRTGYSIFVFLFGFYSLASVLWSPARGAINGAFIKLVVLLFLGLQLQFDYTEKDISTIKKAFIIQGFLLAIVFFIFGVVDWDGRVWIRNGDLSVDPNSIAVWTIIPLCYSFEMVLKKGNKLFYRIAEITLILLMIFIVLQGASRAGIISLAITIFLCIGYGLKNTILRKPIVSFLIVVILFLIGIYIYHHLPATVIKRFNYSNLSNFGGRTSKWSTLMDMLKANPVNMIFGFGESAVMHFTGSVAHNVYVETFFAQGLLGLGLLLAFMIGAFRNVMKNDPYSLFAFVGVAIMSSTLSEFASRGVMFALFIAGARVVRKSNEAKDLSI